ncbi:MAG: hypothetical protein WBA77_04100 [Microcoleaceae cyanobacterium]
MTTNGKTVATLKINHLGKNKMTLNSLTQDQSNTDTVDLDFDAFDENTQDYWGDRVTLYQAYLLGKLLRSHSDRSTTSEMSISHR